MIDDETKAAIREGLSRLQGAIEGPDVFTFVNTFHPTSEEHREEMVHFTLHEARKMGVPMLRSPDD